MTHKFKVGDIIYWVCPITLIIEKLKIEFLDYYDENKEKPWYVVNGGAYIYEFDIRESLEEAKDLAYQGLVRFYFEKVRLIQKADPKLEKLK